MATYRSHVLVCMGSNCVLNQSQSVADAFFRELKRADLDDEIRVVKPVVLAYATTAQQ